MRGSPLAPLVSLACGVVAFGACADPDFVPPKQQAAKAGAGGSAAGGGSAGKAAGGGSGASGGSAGAAAIGGSAGTSGSAAGVAESAGAAGSATAGGSGGTGESGGTAGQSGASAAGQGGTASAGQGGAVAGQGGAGAAGAGATAGSAGSSGCVSSAEVCDGKDNDCDGKIDEELPLLGDACTVGIGACEAKGFKTCKNGSYDGCSVEPLASGVEQCDGKDNDCDGKTDEANLPLDEKKTEHPRGACIGFTSSTDTSGFALSFLPPGGDNDLGNEARALFYSLVFGVDNDSNTPFVDVTVVVRETGKDMTTLIGTARLSLGGSNKAKTVLTKNMTGSESFGTAKNLISLGTHVAGDNETHDYPIPIVNELDGVSYPAINKIVLRISGQYAPNVNGQATRIIVPGKSVAVELAP